MNINTGTLGDLLERTTIRRIAVALPLWAWLIYINATIGQTLGNVFIVLLAVWFWRSACRSYGAIVAQQRPHWHFWLGYGIALFFSASLYQGGPLIGILVTAFGLFFKAINREQSGSSILRGNEASTSRAAQRYYANARSQNDKGILWGGVRVPTEEANTHFLVIGTTGSGKTVTLRLYMQDVLPGVGQPGSRKRALIYDPKTEMYSILEGMGFAPEDIIITNPFDRRCRPWAIARDIETATDAETLATILVPEKKDGKGDDEFWRNATILLIKAVVRYLNKAAPHQWTFRDLLLALRNKATIEKMINDDPRLHHYAQTFGTSKTADSIMATMITKIERFEPIAALWHKAETVYGNKPFSLTEWTEDSKIILLGRSETAERQLTEVNRVIFTRVTELLLERPERAMPETFFILDELGSLGNLEPLLKLATEGRSKGVSLAAGFQAESHIISNFTKEIAITILGQFNHVAALRLRDEESAKWVSGLLGKVQGVRLLQSESRSWGSGRSVSVQEQYYEEDVVMHGELTGIPAFRPKQGIGLTGFYMGHKNWWHTYPASIVQQLAPKTDEERNLLRAPKLHQELEFWDDSDYERLNISHLQDIPLEDMEQALDER